MDDDIFNMNTEREWSPLRMGLIQMIVRISVGNFYIESLKGWISGWLKILFGYAFDRIEKAMIKKHLIEFESRDNHTLLISNKCVTEN